MSRERDFHQERADYRKTLSDLKKYQEELGLGGDPPTESLTIIPGTESRGRPLNAKLPIYPKEKCSIDEEGFGKVMFNLRSLLEFVAPTRRR